MTLYHTKGKHSRFRPVLVAAICSVLALTVLSCSDTSCDCPSWVVPPSGRAVVQAVVRVDEHNQFYTDGFSFSEGGVVRYPNSQGINADLLVFLHFGTHDGPTGLYFVQEELSPSFHHVGRGATMEDGQSQFERTVCLPDSARFADIASMVDRYDVWVVKTKDGRFGKLMVVDTYFCSQSYDSAGTTITRVFGEVTFDWQFQPDGSRCFQ